ncbi:MULTISPECIES: hypothetical protein [Nocardioides]|jgi:hypothetical protein|uniref:hypothetical protein n=1 Tax=Nocardioides TaxID=1839 RepID=UPI000401040A|nr:MULTISPECIES: hypothetical protein [Nocardioides]
MSDSKNRLGMLKDMAKGAKDDPKGAAIFFKDVGKMAAKEAAGKAKGKVKNLRGH